MFLKVDKFFETFNDLPEIRNEFPQLVQKFWLPEIYSKPEYWNKTFQKWPEINQWFSVEDCQVARNLKEVHLKKLQKDVISTHNVSNQLILNIQSEGMVLSLACLSYLEKGFKLEQKYMKLLKIQTKKRRRKKRKRGIYKHIFSKLYYPQAV